MFIRQIVDEVLQIIGIAAAELIAQTTTAPPTEKDQLTQLLEWLNQMPGVGRGLAVFAVVSVVLAAIAKVIDNLDKILSFKAKYLSRHEAEIPEPQLEYLRQQLLKQMKAEVAERLDNSLHNLVRIDLQKEEQRHQVGRPQLPLVPAQENKTLPFRGLIQRGLAVFGNNQGVTPISLTDKTYTLFYRADIGERLLILGEPGVGKTTELLTVAQRLVAVAIEDRSKPIPLLFELSSWTPDTPIVIWLGQQLETTYGVPPKQGVPLARQWIQQTRLLLLLDGLDELGQRNQVACIEALEDFFARHPTLPTIVCCRREEYEQGEKQFQQLRGAIHLQAAEPQQIQQYLKDLKREQLWEVIQNSPELMELAQLPLFLTMLVVAYQGKPIQDTQSLFDAYIQKQLHDRNHQGIYRPGAGKTPQQTLHYLCWLAKQLRQRKETEFLIENLQPDWIEVRTKRVSYRLMIGLIFGLVFGLMSGLMSGLIFGLMSGLGYGLIFGLVFGLVFGLRNIQPHEQLRWSLRTGLIGGLSCGLIGGLSGLMSGLSYGLIFGLIGGLVFGLMNGLRAKAVELKKAPNQGIRTSLQNGLVFGLMSGLVFGLMSMLSYGLMSELMSGLVFGLMSGLMSGLIFGLMSGLGAVIQHFILRLVLTQNGDIPWDYKKFLDHAARHRFIQKTGGRYRFVHDLLRQHLARMTPQQQALLAQKNDG